MQTKIPPDQPPGPDFPGTSDITLFVNGTRHTLRVPLGMPLIQCLRDELKLTGAKLGCNNGECGACTVLVEGNPVCSCIQTVGATNGKRVMTIEGLADQTDLHPVQQSFLDTGAMQCGFCTAGMVLSAVALLHKNPQPSDDDIRHALNGNICRCTGYVKIIEAVRKAANVAARA